MPWQSRGKKSARKCARVGPKPSAFSCDPSRHLPIEEPEPFPDDPMRLPPLFHQGPNFDEEVLRLASCMTVVQQVRKPDFKVTDKQSYEELLIATQRVTKLALAFPGTPLEAVIHRALDVLDVADAEGIVPLAVDGHR